MDVLKSHEGIGYEDASTEYEILIKEDPRRRNERFESIASFLNHVMKLSFHHTHRTQAK